MAALSISFEELYQVVSRFLGYGNTPTDDNLRTAKKIVFRGYRQYLYPIDKRTDKEYCWSFLRQPYTIPIQATKWKYALPENFSEMLTDPVYDDEDGWAALTKISPEQILDLRVNAVESFPPAFYAIATTPYDLEVGTKYELWLHGEPDTSYTLKLFYKIDPLKPENTNDYLVGGVKGIEALTEICLGIAETQEDGEMGIHYKIGKGLLRELIINDSASSDGGSYIGNMRTGCVENTIRRGELARFKLENLYPDSGDTFSE